MRKSQLKDLIMNGRGLCRKNGFRVELRVVPQMPEGVKFVEFLFESQIRLRYFRHMVAGARRCARGDGVGLRLTVRGDGVLAEVCQLRSTW